MLFLPNKNGLPDDAGSPSSEEGWAEKPSVTREGTVLMSDALLAAGL